MDSVISWNRVSGYGRRQDPVCVDVHASLRKRFPSARFAIVVPTLALLDQWYVSLREDLQVPEAEIATYSGESRAAEVGVVNLMVINTARTQAPKVPADSEAMLIVDECHRAASSSNSAALVGHYRATLGISATPEREHDDLFASCFGS